MSRTNRKPYTGSKEFDKTCRGGGSCPHCRSNRQYKNNKKLTLEESLKDHENRD